jgi:hypothetical protein
LTADTFRRNPAEEIKEVEAYLAAEKARLDKLKAERRAQAADPHYQLVKRLRNADFEPWDQLSLEQLQEIAAWLDEVKQSARHSK